MKNGKMQNFNLDSLAGGAFAEKFTKALLEVATNIQDPNTDPTAKRGITVNIKFAPNKNREMVNTTIAVTTKLAAAEEITTQMIMGINAKTGEIGISEYKQTSFFDPGQQYEEASEPTPGKDFDPNTGELYEGDDEGVIAALKTKFSQTTADNNTTPRRLIPLKTAKA